MLLVVLSMLQRARFEALHWFEAVNLHLREEGKALEARRAEVRLPFD